MELIRPVKVAYRAEFVKYTQTNSHYNNILLYTLALAPGPTLSPALGSALGLTYLTSLFLLPTISYTPQTLLAGREQNIAQQPGLSSQAPSLALASSCASAFLLFVSDALALLVGPFAPVALLFALEIAIRRISRSAS